MGGGWLRRGVGSVAAGAPPAGAPPLRPSAVGIRRALLESTRQGGGVAAGWERAGS